MRMKLTMRIAARVSRRDGKLTEEQYQTVMDAIRHPVRKCKDGSTINLMEKIENQVNTEMGKQGLDINWDAIIQWFKDHWLDVLKMIISLLPLFVILDSGPPKE